MYVSFHDIIDFFLCCFNKKNKDDIELLQPLDDVKYNLMDNNDLIPKYLNYNFNFYINENDFTCSTISVISSSIINKNIQYTILSRQNNNKDFFIIQGSNNYKLFEINCIRGDIVNLNFNFNKKITLHIIFTNKNNENFLEKYNIDNKNILISTYENCSNIRFFIKYEDDSFYQDLITQTNIWFKDYDAKNDINLDLDHIIDKINNTILIGYIKLSSNLLIYNI